MKSTVYMVFGNLRGWDERLALMVELDDVSDVLNPTSGGRFGTVRVGVGEAYGPIVMDSPTPQGRTVIVYGGEYAPDWASTSMPEEFGWTRTSDIPIGMSNPLMELDALVLRFDGPESISAWMRTVWIAEAPRPMERISLRAGDEGGPEMALRTLEVGLEPEPDGRKVPYAVFTCPSSIDAEQLREHGWVHDAWSHDRDEDFWHLHKLSGAVEVFTEPLLGYSLVSSVTIHDLSGFDAVTISELPRDVRQALAAEIANNTTSR